MFIIIEGLDRSGKTTLASRLSHSLSLENRHFDKPRDHPLEEYLRPLEAGAVDAVFDRYHLGERVWPAIFGRDSEYDDEMHHHVELTLLSRGAVLVEPRRSFTGPDELDEALRGEPIDRHQYLDARRRFRHELERTLLRSRPWELTSPDERMQRQEIVRVAAEEATTTRPLLKITPRWIGWSLPNVLLVGAEVGDRSWSLPFVPHRNTSGHYLMKALLTIQPRFVIKPAIVNSHKPDGSPESVRELWEEMSSPRIVALGKDASSRLTKAGLPHERVHHPQYVRRFQRRRGPDWYATEIRKAANL